MEKKLLVIVVQTAERAAIIAAKLGSEGIECMLNSLGAQIDPLYAGVEVLVNEMDVARAMELLADLHFEFGDDKPRIEKSKDEVVTIAVNTWQKAELMHQMLEAAGIQSALLNVNLLQSGVSAGVKLRVFESDASRAMNIIKDVLPEEKEAGVPAYAMGEILVPVDFSDTSIIAVRMAAKLAMEAEVPLRLLHVHYTPVLSAMPFEEATYSMQSSVAELFKDTEAELLKSMERLSTQIHETMHNALRPLKVLSTVIRGMPSDAILDFALHHNAGMIVMSKGLYADQTGLFMGSVCGKVAERAQVPVLVLPNDYPFKGLFQIGNIAYASNFESADHKAMQRLWRTSRYFAAKYFFLHISVPGEEEIDVLRLQDIASDFEALCSREVSWEVFGSRDLLAGFNRFIKENEIHMLAMTTHRRNLLTEMFYPSLTQRMMLHSDLPLLIFHA